MWSSRLHADVHQFGVKLGANPFKNPLTLKLADYPSRIVKETRINLVR